jgi:hypothetical protein
VNTTTEITKLGIENNINLIVISINNDIEAEVRKLVNTIRESIRNGTWIIVENVHLIDQWPEELLMLIYVNKNLYFSPFFKGFLIYLKLQ